MVRFLLHIYTLIIIVDAVLTYLPQYKNHEYVKFIRKLADYSLNPVRKILPQDLAFDFSPLVVILLIRVFIAVF